MDNSWITTGWLAGKLLGTKELELLLELMTIPFLKAWVDLEVKYP